MRALVKLGVALVATTLTASPAPAQTPDSTDIVVAATTDVHGRIVGWDYYANREDSARGLSRAATIIDSVRAANPSRVVLVDAGDLLEGNPFAYVAARVRRQRVHPVIAAMNALHYDAAVIGNHEFNYGLPFLRKAIGEARFPFLAANAQLSSGKAAFASWHIVRRGQVKVGIVGATTPGSNLWDHDNLHGRLVIRDIVPAVNGAVRAARRAGADIVVVALHSGLDEPSSYDTVATHLPSENVSARVAHEVPGVDLIVYGHSHREMADTTVNGVLMMQPKNWATSVGVAHVVIRRNAPGAPWTVSRKWSSLVNCVGHAESPAIVAAASQAQAATVRYVETPIGHTAAVWRADSARVRDTPLIDFVLDVERRATHADLASTAAFSLDASLDSGAITIAEVARLYPYDNTLKSVRISGKQLREYLEFSARYFGQWGSDAPPVNPRIPGYNFDIVSGASYTIDVSRPVGSRITALSVKGRPVADGDTFTMAVNNYRQSGGGGYAMLRGAPVVFDGQTEIRQLLIGAVKAQRRLDPARYARPTWTLVPAAARDSAYAAMHRQPREGDVAARRVPNGRRVRTEAARLPVRVTVPADSGVHYVRLRLISTNDFHGALDPVSDARGGARGGADAMAATIERAERECAPPSCATLLVDAGDLFQGSAASNLAFGAPVVALYNQLGYAAAAIGNHEFDWGVDTLRARMRDARFAILAANVRDAQGRMPAWARDDTIIDRGALRIGVIGVIGPETYHSIMPARVAGLRFDDPAPIIDSLARSLRARGVDAVIVLAHSGAFCDDDGSAGCHGAIVDMARSLTEPVNAIVSGHTHSLVDTRVDRVPIVQARSSGRSVAVVDLAIAPTSARDSVLSQVVVDAAIDGDAPAAADSIVRAADARVAALEQRPVATLAAAMPRAGSQYPLGNLIADAQRWAGKADVAVVNNGGIRQDLPAGATTWGALFAVQPFGNTLERITVPGAALRAYLETLVDAQGEPRSHVSGVTLAFDLSRPAGARLVSASLPGRGELRDDARYTIVLNDFMSTGPDGGILTNAAVASEPLEPNDLDALVSYLSSRPQPVAAPHETRITISHR